jgi:hypothetical protein
METEITLEFGKDLNESKIVHEEMLRCHSAAARTLFDKAKPMRDNYSQADHMRKDLKNIVSAHGSGESFDERIGSKKVCQRGDICQTVWTAADACSRLWL